MMYKRQVTRVNNRKQQEASLSIPRFHMRIFQQTDQTWTMMASIQGYPVRASLHAASNSSSSSQGIYSGMQNLVINDETI